MELGFIGLGRMGANMAERLLRGKHRVVAYNRTAAKTQDIMKKGAEGAFSLEELAVKLAKPRAVWIMVPAGDATQKMIDELVPHLAPGDLIIDGGNSRYSDSMRRFQELRGKNIHFMDAGTSGGIWGLKVGYCLMVGGEAEDFRRLEPALATLAPNTEGVLHCGPAGAGHFVKMVHNGIEYGLMQSYAEGFEILKTSPFNLNLKNVSHLWNQGSVVRSWLLELAESAFEKDPDLARISDYVEDSGEGRWTVQQAMDSNVPAPVITYSLFARFLSRQPESFAAKVLAALRAEFGGHAVKTK
ncbi:MAG: decarboxylating 6-phosphogluconate dehydrogenase [Elusimicrobia bacterium]|nr:decarboxylating 6-phosphogluconate dehydrogenase [Elusimicrobiota bacterium]